MNFMEILSRNFLVDHDRNSLQPMTMVDRSTKQKARSTIRPGRYRTYEIDIRYSKCIDILLFYIVKSNNTLFSNVF